MPIVSTITRDDVIAAAFSIVEEEGAPALSMRRIGDRVGRRVSSLYNHVASRGDLIEAMRAVVVAEIDVSGFTEHEWHVALEDWARSYLAAFVRHHSLVELLASTPIQDESTLAMYEVVVSGLHRGGWPMHDTVAVMRAVEALVIGAALDIAAPDDFLDRARVRGENTGLRAALNPAFAGGYSATRAFDIALNALMSGLRVMRE